MAVISVPFSIIESNGLSQNAQPISMGCPFSLGSFVINTPLAIRKKDGQLVSCQISPLTYWHDGSVKWATIDFVIDIKSNETLALTLTNSFSGGDLSTHQQQISFIERDQQLEVNTGVESFFVNTVLGEPLSIVNSSLSDSCTNTDRGASNKDRRFYVVLVNSKNEKFTAVVDAVCVDSTESSSHKKTLAINGRFIDENNKCSGILFESSLTFFTNTSYIKNELTIHNPQAALHPGGLWDLGDQGSILFKSLSVNISVDHNTTVTVHDHISNESIECGKNALVEQFSSGGINWQSPVHKNSVGKVDIDKNGFEINFDTKESAKLQINNGFRISPVFSVQNSLSCTSGNKTRVNNAEEGISVYVENFWQNFPKVISKQDELLTVALFPDGEFELQGGEKKTHSLWIDFSSSEQKFNWLDKRLTLIIEPEYIQLSGAFDFFTGNIKPDGLSAIIEQSINGESNFFAKREAVDEFGWRNFGDLYADHETEGHTGNDIFVSHYNNQYDPIYGFIYQYLTTGNVGYFELANDLTQHVTDIDIYHTINDKDEYNGGLFWHTDHYLDASTATHRTFSKNHQAAYEDYTSGGGPGGQHCYTTGLKSQYLLTGNESAKKAVLQLTDWVSYFYEGSNSFIAKLFAIKQSGTHDLKNHVLDQYPLDRGTGHYIIALLDSYDLTLDKSYLARAFKVISHTFHPNDDISLRNFDNIEATWFYTVFLQAVGRFLLIKERMSQLDDDFYFARDAMLHYAHWMLDNELPYLEQADKLEFPNTTWAGQDLRKVGVFYMAHYYTPIKNSLFIQQAEYFHQHILKTLQNDPNNDYTRILVLLMQNIGFANYYKHAVNQNKFEAIREYREPKQINKVIKISTLLLKEISHLSIKNEVKWLSLRSAKVAKLMGNKN